ncbi:MAG: dephospho-CoA kinase [Oscillospiraceae bacterium]|jgi:dephospho-CoA kinase|nr:dephospho-CoA kinase [Oscillospiraceae bacterium]
MHIIGLTGGIASGKSTFSSMLRKLGAPVVDADAVSRALTAAGGAALPGIRDRFGGDVFAADGTLNRAALAEIVFNSEQSRRDLESIVHPMVIAECSARLAVLCESGVTAAVLEAPLLIESGMHGMCDEIWVTYCPVSTQLERLMERDRLTAKQANARIASQTPFHEKARLADVILPMLGSRMGICAMAARQWNRATMV